LKNVTKNFFKVYNSLGEGIRAIFFIVLVMHASLANADFSNSFSSAKQKMYKEVYNNEWATFYTGCYWRAQQVSLESCGLADSFPNSANKRARRTEPEHVIPASWLYKKNKSWRDCYLDAKQLGIKARDYCQDNDLEFRDAHNDLVNLRPVVGQVNGFKGNKPFLEKVSGEKIATLKAKKKFVVSSRGVTPDPSIRGDIARIAFYMRDKYQVEFSPRQEMLFFKWAEDNPVSEEEIELNRKIEEVQGVGNQYVQ
jgi:deoxyribonuclease-1